MIYMFVFKSMYIYISIQIYSKYMNIEEEEEKKAEKYLKKMKKSRSNWKYILKDHETIAQWGKIS